MTPSPESFYKMGGTGRRENLILLDQDSGHPQKDRKYDLRPFQINSAIELSC